VREMRQGNCARFEKYKANGEREMRKAKLASAVLALSISLCAFAQQGSTSESGRVVFKNAQEATSYYENLMSEMVSRIRGMQEDNAQMVASINELQKQVQALSQSNQALAQDVATLKSQMAAESDSRQAQMNQVVDKVKSAIKSSVSSSDSSSGASSSSSQEMIEYTVQTGATLSLVAKAFKVSVDEIKKANGLKSDIIRPGQKLLIPKK
jgi:LysM repeat protein